MTQPPERADHLVADQQHAIPVADLADARPVSGRRRERPAGVLQRLHEHRGNGLRPFHLDAQFEVIRTAQRAGVEVLAVVASVAVRRLHLDRPRHQRLERSLDRGHAGHAERPDRGAVVGEVARDHLRARGLAAQLEVLARQLDRGVDGLAARRSQEHPVEVTGRQFGKARGQFDGRFVGERPDREVAERLGLARRCFAQLGPTVPRLHREQPGEPVEVPLAVLVPHVAALAAGDDRHLTARRTRRGG